jgi:murein DD-endopeptidase MepM/ murein hydrolase activator NlpD
MQKTVILIRSLSRITVLAVCVGTIYIVSLTANIFPQFYSNKKEIYLAAYTNLYQEQVNNNGWFWPSKGKVTSVVGMRHQPVTGEWRMHQGIDIKYNKGSRINAARTGKIVATNSTCHKSRSNCGGGYGNYVVIKHGNGLYSIYAHLSKINTRVGTRVSAGDKIGEMGNTGLTKDTHLHFGIGPTIWVNSNVRNPLSLLPKK